MHIHRTCRATILTHSQVAEMLDRHGWSAAKLWNVANYHSREVWDETGEIPDDSVLKRELKPQPTPRTNDSTHSPVSAFWKHSLKPSTRTRVVGRLR
nr:hypothetical protein [Haloquadratum walsbyi]